ncbi:MAG TPA: hypothetical protein GXX72_07365, partial [Clostridiaceae bacterium]|nr:hypothetical protein [Clostridiaceae bacterium]
SAASRARRTSQVRQARTTVSRARQTSRIGRAGSAASRARRARRIGRVSRAGSTASRVRRTSRFAKAGKASLISLAGLAGAMEKAGRFGIAGKAGISGLSVASRAGISGISGMVGSANKVGIAGIAGRAGRIAGRSLGRGLGLGLSAYGIAEGDPIEITLAGADAIKGGVKLAGLGANVSKAGANIGYRIGGGCAKFTYRQALKVDNIILNKAGSMTKAVYTIGKTGAKYAYRIPKVIGGFVYTPIRESATRMALRLAGTRTYRLASRSYKLCRSTYGVLRAGPVETIKAGAKVSYRIGYASAKFTYRQAIRVDKYLLRKSLNYGKIRQSMEGVYHLGKTGAKYAYRTPKVLGHFVYNPLKSAGMDIVWRVQGTRAYRLGSRGLRAGQKTVGTAKAGARATYQIGRAGALRAYRMSTAPFRYVNRWAQRSARIAMRAMMHFARLIAAKIAGVLMAVASAIIAAIAPILPIIIAIVAVLSIILLLYSIVALIFPTNFILIDREVLINYIERVRIYDSEFVEGIGQIKQEATQEYIYACPSRDIKDRWGIIERVKRPKYNEGIHVIYENIEPVDGHICTDWHGIIALAAVLNNQNFEFSQAEQELIRQIHGKLNRVEHDMETLPCPCYAIAHYKSGYYTPCYACDYEYPETDPNLSDDEKAAKEAEKEKFENTIKPNLSPCCALHCTSEWGCYNRCCCPGH